MHPVKDPRIDTSVNKEVFNQQITHLEQGDLRGRTLYVVTERNAEKLFIRGGISHLRDFFVEFFSQIANFFLVLVGLRKEVPLSRFRTMYHISSDLPSGIAPKPLSPRTREPLAAAEPSSPKRPCSSDLPSPRTQESLPAARSVRPTRTSNQEWSSTTTLCWNPMPPSEAAKNYSGNQVKINGLQKLNSLCDFVKIKGEGHCLFRAIATGLLCNYTRSSELERTQFQELLRNIRAGIGRDIPGDQWDKAMQSLRTTTSMEKVFESMNVEETSNAWVFIMRFLAAEQLRQAPEGDNRTSIARIAIDGDLNEHCDQMKDMNRNMYGDEPEKTALSELFHIGIQTYELRDIGSKGIHPAPLDVQGLNLIFDSDRDGSNGHYNLAIPPRR